MLQLLQININFKIKISTVTGNSELRAKSKKRYWSVIWNPDTMESLAGEAVSLFFFTGVINLIIIIFRLSKDYFGVIQFTFMFYVFIFSRAGRLK